ncbi:MAG: class I SAM-dependent methyltransferase [Acidimicrobiia bacterium]
MTKLASELRPGTALDLGCGAGQNSVWLAQRGWTLTGVDFAPSAIAQAEAAAQSAGVAISFLVGDLEVWEPNQLFDLVFSTYAQPPRGSGRSHGLATAAGAVKRGGTLMVVEFDQTAGLWNDDDLLTLEEVTEHLDDFEASRAEIEITKHAHGHEGSDYPVVVVVAKRL